FRPFSCCRPLTGPPLGCGAEHSRFVNEPGSGNMDRLQKEMRAFRARKETEQAHATQMAAFFLLSGIDLDEALNAPPARQRLIRFRLERLLERERLRGGARHWSYDLNRHIALKQALDRLVAGNGACCLPA